MGIGTAACIGSERLTLALSVHRLKVMVVNFSSEVQAKLDRAASESGAGPVEYVQQLVEHYIDHDEWFRRKVKKGLEQLDRGEFITHEQMGTRIDEMFRV